MKTFYEKRNEDFYCRDSRYATKTMGYTSLAKQIQSKPDSVLGLAPGSTPEGLYAKLAQATARGEVDFSAVRTVNLDEYYPISPDNDQSYRYFMNRQLLGIGRNGVSALMSRTASWSPLPT